MGALLVGYLAGGMHPALGSVVAGPGQLDAVELEGLMRGMESGLEEMAGSAEQMMAALTTSPRVHAAAEAKVAALRADPELQAEMLRIVRAMHQTLLELNVAMEAPDSRAALVAHASSLEGKVQEVAQDLAAEAPGRRLAAGYAVPNLRPPAAGATRAGAPEMKGVNGLLYGGVKTADGDLYGNFFEKQSVSGAIKSGDVGTTFPLGVWDPLNLIGNDAVKYRRWQEMEIKHGRLAMAAFVHVIVTEAGIRWPGYLSDGTFGGEPIKFADMPAGTIASWAAMPPLGWAQIIAFIGVLDSRAIQSGLPEDLSEKLFGQDPNRAPGDVASQLGAFKRQPDKALRDYKLNVERNNGRAAMFGIIGMMIHEQLTGNPLFPFTQVA